MYDDARAIWDRLIWWATRWDLPEPRVSAGWIDLPPSFVDLARDGWIERPLMEPPASATDEAALVQESALALPEDLRALHAIHDGSFAPLLPCGMTLFPYGAMRTTWRWAGGARRRVRGGSRDHGRGAHAFDMRLQPSMAADCCVGRHKSLARFRSRSRWNGWPSSAAGQRMRVRCGRTIDCRLPLTLATSAR